MIREFYIQAVATSDTLSGEYKTLIPDATMRRRMSKILKCGVATGMECLATFGGNVDAIITGSGFGCLQDSEKFLRTMIENNEQQLNPTPFIQSTFNTIGAQIALLSHNYSYNTTYSHGGDTFIHVLIDAAMLLNEGAANYVLAGVADEITPALENILNRLRVMPAWTVNEYAVFMVLSAVRNDKTIASVRLYSEEDVAEETDVAYRFFPVSYAFRLVDAVNEIRAGAEVIHIKTGSQRLFNKAEIRCC